MEVVDSVLFSQLNMDFEARLEKIFKQLEIFRFLIERGHHWGELDFGNLEILLKVLSNFAELLLFANC